MIRQRNHIDRTLMEKFDYEYLKFLSTIFSKKCFFQPYFQKMFLSTIVLLAIIMNLHFLDIISFEAFFGGAIILPYPFVKIRAGLEYRRAPHFCGPFYIYIIMLKYLPFSKKCIKLSLVQRKLV